MTLQCRLVIQQNHELGETNLHFITDPTIPLEDYLVTAGSWRSAEVRIIPVQVTSSEEVLHILDNREFRCVDNRQDDVPVNQASDEALEQSLQWLSSAPGRTL